MGSWPDQKVYSSKILWRGLLLLLIIIIIFRFNFFCIFWCNHHDFFCGHPTSGQDTFHSVIDLILKFWYWNAYQIKGLADGLNGTISYDALLRFHLFPELIKASCSMFGAWGPALANSTGSAIYLLLLASCYWMQSRLLVQIFNLFFMILFVLVLLASLI